MTLETTAEIFIRLNTRKGIREANKIRCEEGRKGRLHRQRLISTEKKCFNEITPLYFIIGVFLFYSSIEY